MTEQARISAIKQIKLILSMELPPSYSPRLDEIAKFQLANVDFTTGEYVQPSHMTMEKRTKRHKLTLLN